MLTDAASIGLSLIALRLAQRPPRGGLTYGLKRAEILSALTNGATLLAISVLIVYEAIRRLLNPPRSTGSSTTRPGHPRPSPGTGPRRCTWAWRAR